MTSASRSFHWAALVFSLVLCAELTGCGSDDGSGGSAASSGSAGAGAKGGSGGAGATGGGGETGGSGGAAGAGGSGGDTGGASGSSGAGGSAGASGSAGSSGAAGTAGAAGSGGTAGAAGSGGTAGAAGSGGTAGAPTGDTFEVPPGSATFNCQTAGVGPGDILDLGSGTRGPLTISSCHGSPTSYIKIVNDTAAGSRLTVRTTQSGDGGGGVLVIKDSTYFHLDGRGKWSGAPAGVCGVDKTTFAEGRTQCGIEVTRTGTGKPSHYLRVTGVSHHFKLTGIEIDGGGWSPGGPGIGIDINDHTVDAADHPGVWREKILIEQNYVHDHGGAGGEGMYLGPNGKELDLPLRNNEYAYNLVENSATDNINVKYHLAGTTLVHHNHLYKSGLAGLGSNGFSGIGMHDGSNVWVYGNYIENSAGTCVNSSANTVPSSIYGQPVTALFMHVWNNILVRCGQLSGINGHGISFSFGLSSLPDLGPTSAEHNTIIAPRDHGINWGSNVSATRISRNNLVTDLDTGKVLDSGETASQGNRSGTTAAQNFANPAADNYELTSTSPACNSGVASAINDDYEAEVRPQDTAPDQGADEAAACP